MIARMGTLVGAQAAHRVAATAVAMPVARCQGLHLGAASQQPSPVQTGSSAAASGGARRHAAFAHGLRRRNASAAAFSDHQPGQGVDNPSSRTNGDPGATTSASNGAGEAANAAPPASDAQIAVLRAELESLRHTVSTQARHGAVCCMQSFDVFGGQFVPDICYFHLMFDLLMCHRRPPRSSNS